MDDFIFGTLATDELRQAHVRSFQAGITHNHARRPRTPKPGQEITLELSVGPAHLKDRAWVYWTTDGSDPQGQSGNALRGQVIAMEESSMEWNTSLWGYVRHFRAVLPGQARGTLVRYCISAGSEMDEEVFADNHSMYAFTVGELAQPEWVEEAVVYHIFVDRFYPGHSESWNNPAGPAGFYGGTLRGISDKLDYISDLGANALWLSPIFPSPSHHGYDSTDIFEIEPRLGTKQDFRMLLDKAHARGIRVFLDFVPSHWSFHHPTFQQAIRDQTGPYVDWYFFSHWPDEYETFFGVRELPQINLRNIAARAHILKAIEHWLEIGVDGFRIDYAIGPTPDFWGDFRKTISSKNPDCWTFGEVVDPPDRQVAFEGLLDGCLDFLLLEAFRQTFAYGRWEANRFFDFLDRHEKFFPRSFSRPSFLDNHDMNRFLWAAGGEKRRLMLAALCQFTLAGTPVVYYGTEVGLSQERDIRQDGYGFPEEARLPMPWEQDQDGELLSFYRELIKLRKSEKALRSGTRQALHSNVDTLAFKRSWGDEEITSVLNISKEPQRVYLEGPWYESLLATDQACKVEFNGKGVNIDLPAISGVILKEA
jgi:cyclomaltodextrinase / maltogenic alpha-amylase / neopullulanase